MKPLLLCASSSRTGPVEGLISLAVQLRSLGVEAHFAGDTLRPGEDLPGHLRAAGVPFELALRLSRKSGALDLLHDARLLRRWVRAGRFDVLHAAFAHDHLLSLFARRPGCIVVRAVQRRADLQGARRLWALRRSDGVTVHSLRYQRDLLAALGPRARLRDASSLAPGRYLHGASNPGSAAERLRETSQSSPQQSAAPVNMHDAYMQDAYNSRVGYVPPSVDAARFTPGPRALRAKWGVADDAPLAGIVARMKPERGHRALLAAFAQVPAPATLVLIGRGEDEAELRRLAPARVVFAGYARGDELIDACRALDVAVWLREGNDGACRGVLEAMACGVPLIVGDDGAPPELVRDGRDGLVVDPGDPVSIAKALNALLNDRARAAQLGASARARSLEFTPLRAARETLSFWERLRAQPRS